MIAVHQFLTGHYRLPPALAQSVQFSLSGSLGDRHGFFRFGEGIVGYGQAAGGNAAPSANGNLSDLSSRIIWQGDGCRLPFDPLQVIDNLRLERYAQSESDAAQRLLRRIYYGLRPALPDAARKGLQSLYIGRRAEPPFPGWPVDRTVDRLAEALLLLVLKKHSPARLPFIWFWPDGHSGCALLTHDVETRAGRDFCKTLMDIDDSFGFKSAFMLVPEKRYPVEEPFLDEIRRRGFEIGIQGLNHDGLLFASRKIFLERAPKINEYAKRFGAGGFRSPVMYRRPEWHGELEFSYDMSLPNSARLEAQRGGCCTAMPFFIGDVLELPLTTTQDYALFHYLKDHSIGLWKRQSRMVLDGHGLLSFLVHPDYVIAPKARQTYLKLLEHLACLRRDESVWVALPGQAADWWRRRSRMEIERQDGRWRIRGKGSERARLAFAVLEGDQVRYEVQREGAVS